MNEKEITSKIDQGWIRAKTIFEIVGNPKDHVVQVINTYISALKKNKGIEVLQEEVGEPEEKDKIWSTYAELDMLVEGLEKFVYICVTFTPASIEIIDPKELTFSDKNMTDWLNELLSLLHEIGMKAKTIGQENDLLKKSLNNLMQNIIVLGLEKPKSKKDLAKTIGADDKMLQPFLDVLEKRGRIKKQDGAYARIDG